MTRKLQVDYLGEHQTLEFDDEDVVTFPDGVVGFNEWRRFVWLEDPESLPLGVLHCLDDTKVSFLVTSPWQVYPEYRFSLPVEVLRQLGLQRQDEARVLCILTSQNGPIPVTANLLAPLIINPCKRLACQVILQDSQYSIQHPVLVVEPPIGVADDTESVRSNDGLLPFAGRR